MIVFRKDQLDAFKSVAETDFERVLVRKLMEAFPRSNGWYGEPALAALARLGLERARKLGLDHEGDILRYLGVMLTLGSGFDSDPQLLWAARALSAPAGGPLPKRVEALWELARAYTARVLGADYRHYLSALRNLEGRTVESLIAVAGRSTRDLMMQLATLHPQKAAEVGESSMQDLARHAVEVCRPLEIATREGVVLMTILMFFFGVGLMSDPLTAWAPEALSAPGSGAVEEKLGRLLAAAVQASGRMLL